ncbi:MAG: hypothetical protein MPK05_06760 [Gammaproteobacteria bacterium]|nr:hypothetical protein [Gammaproteobacteria bacterium]
MLLRCAMVLAYIAFCGVIATRPCKYFQLNAKYFSRGPGIFSKLRIDRMIPAEWRLAQWADDGVRAPAKYPVFAKPEWGQNAAGVRRADDAEQLRRIRAGFAREEGCMLIQECAPGANEYEIFSVRHHRDARPAMLTLTQACNDHEAHPVNSINNRHTRYADLTASLDAAQRDALWEMVRRIGDFPISRVCARADSLNALLRGAFHVVEVNLFLPMPLNLLDRAHSRAHILRFALACMWRLALATRHRDKRAADAPVFIMSMLYNRRGAFARALRARL